MAADLTTADVYEDASLIGQDIEKIIERFGHDAVLDLMPKVVNVLEKLELVVGGREKDKLEIAELKLENERLYLDIKREASQRRRLDEELYQISSTGEADSLKSMLVKLQDENRKLRLEYEVSANSQPAYVSAPGDAELMHKMKETIDNQRDNIRSKNLEIESQKNDVEAMEEQIDRLTNINQSVRRSMVAGQQRISILAKEKAELQAELRAFTRTSQSQKDSDDEEDFEKGGSSADSDSESELNGTELGQPVEEGKVQKIGDDNIEDWDEPPPKPPRLHVECEEAGDELNNNENILAGKEKDAKEGIKENGLENGSDDEKQNDWEIVEQWKLPGKGGKSEERNAKAKEERTQNDKEKKDPNRPRYTKAELLEILTERNKLKEKVWALQEELKVYKPGDAEVEDDGKLNSSVTSPRRESRKEESGISRIFNIFARKGES